LAPNQRRFLSAEAHALEPSATSPRSGYSESFASEVARQLGLKELIKVRLEADDRKAFAALAERLALETGAALVKTVGRVAVLYRPAAEPRLVLPPSRDSIAKG
jgi:RNA-binding protein